ncbi:MAG: glucose-phosphatase [Patescibacteria group bacterium]|nr:glucose-phosphatase [Patescibacteria group bacterium]
MYSTIFFDWSGVVADDSGDIFIRELFLGIGANNDQVNDIIKTYFKDFSKGILSEIEFWDKIRVNYNLQINEPISKEFKKWKGLVANQNIISLANEAKCSGLSTAVLTNIIEPIYTIIKQAGYYDKFDETIASCKVGFVKPQKEIYQLALNKLKTTAQQSIFIDDKLENINVAAKMGFKVILAENPNQIIHDVRNII